MYKAAFLDGGNILYVHCDSGYMIVTFVKAHYLKKVNFTFCKLYSTKSDQKSVRYTERVLNKYYFTGIRLISATCQPLAHCIKVLTCKQQN